jgi:outer membrane usher protein
MLRPTLAIALFWVPILVAAADDHRGPDPAETDQSAAAIPQYRLVILAVVINGLPGDLGTVFIQDQKGLMFATAAVLKAMNLRSSDFRVVAPDGTLLFELGRIPGLSYELNLARGEIAISATPEAFLPTRINIGAAAAQRVASYTPGSYLNYDLSLTNGGGIRTGQGLFDLGLFRGEGLFTSSFTAGTQANARLMTTYQTDLIDEIKTLRIGDSFNATGSWGQGVLFGGIQYGTNFAIRPDFISTAMPSVSGKALLPSTVNVYVDNVLRTTQNVNAGPFSIQNLPAVTGAGTMQIVVTDLLGREQLISQPFFATPTLLRAGLVQDAYEFGWLRQNYGLTSTDYGDPFATATYRKGLTDELTGEARIELQQNLAAGGLTAAHAIPGIDSVVQATAAVSGGSGLAPGVMGTLTYSYLGKLVSANLRMQLDSPTFRQLGSNLAGLPRQIDSAQVSAPVGKGTLSLTYLRSLTVGTGVSPDDSVVPGQNLFEVSSPSLGESRTSIANLGFSYPLSDHAFLSFSALRSLASSPGTTVGLVLTFLFDKDHLGSSTLNRQSGVPSLYTQFQQTTPRDEGTGYRLAMLNGGDTSRQEASVMRNQSFGSYELDLVRQNGQVNERLSAQGGIDYIDNGIFFSRGLADSFAIVQVGDFAGIPVYLENQVMGHTDQYGRAVISNLLPYQKNHISIDPLTLPLDASVSDVERIVVPRTQGGVLVDFEVRTVHGATLTILQSDGNPLPPWTPVEVIGTAEAFVSGNRGEVSVNLPALKGNRVIARPVGGPVCELTVDLPSIYRKAMPMRRYWEN